MRIREISSDGLSLIKRHEGLRLKAYKCPAGVWTIGYGHTRGVTAGMTITEEIADRLLREDVRDAERSVNALGVSLRQGQFDALVSFIFNVGEGNFNRSTLKKKILAQAKGEAEIAEEFQKWVYSGKTRLPGLVRRREEEAETWMI